MDVNKLTDGTKKLLVFHSYDIFAKFQLIACSQQWKYLLGLLADTNTKKIYSPH